MEIVTDKPSLREMHFVIVVGNKKTMHHRCIVKILTEHQPNLTLQWSNSWLTHSLYM